MRASNEKLLTWLNYYGLMRKARVPVGNASRTAQLSDEEAIALLAAHVNAATEVQAGNAAASAAGQEMAKSILNAIPFGSLLSSVLDIAVAVIAPFFKINTQQGCDEHKCKGNVDYDRRHYVGIYPPPGRRWPGTGPTTPLVSYLHDGFVFPLRTQTSCRLVPASGRFTTTPEDIRNGRWGNISSSACDVRVISRSRKDGDHDYTTQWEVIPADDLYPGKALGVDATRYRWEPAVRKFRNYSVMPRAWKSVGLLAEGTKTKPWNQPNTYFYRKWAATRMLRWLQDAVPCPNLICLSSVISAIGNPPTAAIAASIPDPKTAAKMGSLWFASLYYMHKDFNDLATANPSKAQTVLRSLGAAKALSKVGYRKSTSQEDRPYGLVWWSVSRELSFAQLKRALVLLSQKTATLTPSGHLATRVRWQPTVEQQAQSEAPSSNLPTILGVLSVGGLLVYALAKR